MIKLSIIIPGIRPENWLRVCNAIEKASTVSTEIIFVSPHDLPVELQSKANVKHINSKASPTVCAQLGSIEAVGQYVVFGCDDGFMNAGTQEQIWNMLEGQDRKTVVMGKYTEGPPGKHRKFWKCQLADSYYHPSTSMLNPPAHIPKTYKSGSFSYMDRSYFKEIGGYDCQFETGALGTVDVSLRAQRDGSNFVLINTVH